METLSVKIDFDIRKILSIPALYSFYQNIIGDKKLRKVYTEEFIKPQSKNKVLDFGCGPGNILSYLPEDIEYVGFDTSQKYINKAKKSFGHRGTFLCNNVTSETIQDESSFDIALANGVLHHLTDSEAKELFKLAAKALKHGGRLVTYDGCYLEKQSLISKFFLRMDRGKYVRTKDEYFKLASSSFGNVEVVIRENLYKIPYTIIFLVCTK
jgi:SAM-dependent methyltransferase